MGARICASQRRKPAFPRGTKRAIGAACGSEGRRASCQSLSFHSYLDRKTIEAFFDGTSVRKAIGSAFSRTTPSAPRGEDGYLDLRPASRYVCRGASRSRTIGLQKGQVWPVGKSGEREASASR